MIRRPIPETGRRRRPALGQRLILPLVLFFARGESANQSVRDDRSENLISSRSMPAGLSMNEMFVGSCMFSDVQEQAVLSNANFPFPPNRLGGDVSPIRAIVDQYPSFNGVALDTQSNLAFLSDTNRKSLLVYERTASEPNGTATMPVRRVTGPSTLIGYISGLAIDNEKKEVFAVNNDIEDSLMVFSYDANGDAKPKRVLAIPHGAWGISLSNMRNEFSMSIQDGSSNAVVTYRHDARGFDAPVRVLQGSETELADPHGIAVDDTHSEILVTNWGSWNVPLGRYASPNRDQIDLPGGKFLNPSITVYEASASGNVGPVRKIEGPATQLRWPTGIVIDSQDDAIVVANNMDDSVLFFHRTDNGNNRPFKVLRGRRTGIVRPMGVAIDRANHELWVANFGDHTAVVFDLKSTGNAAPKRIVRNAPKGTPSTGFGNPITIGYDVNREEILVPN